MYFLLLFCFWLLSSECDDLCMNEMGDLKAFKSNWKTTGGNLIERSFIWGKYFNNKKNLTEKNIVNIFLLFFSF